MNLSVPTNWDDSLIRALEEYPVRNVYGKLQTDVAGGGKPGFILPKISKRHAKDHIERIHSSGFEFTYLLNSSCLGNMEYDKKRYGELAGHLEWIRDVGTDSVTVAVPFIADMIKKQFPELKIKVSVIAHANSVNKVKMWERLGADEIHLDFNINRDFGLLKRIADNADCGLCLLLNDSCLYECPFRNYHYNISAHASQRSDALKGFYVEYCMANCTYTKLKNPEEILKSRWIRPEDMHHYEKIGIDNFKVAGRSQDTQSILKMVGAYSSRKFDGNLMDILEGTFRKSSTKIPSVDRFISSDKRNMKRGLYEIMRLFYVMPFKDKVFGSNKVTNFATRLNPKKIGMVMDLYKNLVRFNEYTYIDNSELDGFIDFFRKNDCRYGCLECGHCSKWADKSMRLDEVGIGKTISLLEEFLEEMNSGAFFE